MVWSKNDFPDAFKNLDEKIRDKAIEIANALVKEGQETQKSIAIAISNAKDKIKTDNTKNNYHLIPFSDGWAIKRELTDEPLSTHKTKDDALEAGKKTIKNNNSKLYIHREDGTFQSILYG